MQRLQKMITAWVVFYIFNENSMVLKSDKTIHDIFIPSFFLFKFIIIKVYISRVLFFESKEKQTRKICDLLMFKKQWILDIKRGNLNLKKAI